MQMRVQHQSATDGCYVRLSIDASTRLSYHGRQRIVLTSGAALRFLAQDTLWR